MTDNYIRRELESKIDKYLPLKQIIAVVGPRRSGKTTFLKHIGEKMPGSLYLSFENQKILDLFDLEIDEFAGLYLSPNKTLILDEFQYAKNGGKNLKYLFDTFPGHKIIISGSSAPELTIKALKYLVGRVLIFTLYPFSFNEFLGVKSPKLREMINQKSLSETLQTEILSLLAEYVTFGGYPEVVLEKNKEIKKTYLENIYSLFFLREIRDLIGLSDDYKFKILLKALSLSMGNIIEYQELSRTSGLEFRALKQYLNLLEKTFVTFPARPYFTNKRVELVKNPKIYFFDPGLRNVLIDNFGRLENRTDKGAIIENFVATIVKTAGLEPKFWRTKSGTEVDFIIETGKGMIAVEVKSKTTGKTSSGLESFVQRYPSAHKILLGNKLDNGALPYWSFSLGD